MISSYSIMPSAQHLSMISKKYFLLYCRGGVLTMKKNKILVFSITVLLLLLTAIPLYADKEKKNSGFKPQVFTVDGRKYEVYVLWADMKDKRNYVDVSLAKGKIGSLESLKSLSDRAENESDEDIVLGAINGTFFNMTDNSSPINTIIKDGEIKFAGTWASLATFNGNNEMSVSRPIFKVMGSINDQWDWPYGFIAKSVNKFNEEQYGVSIIDKSFNGVVPKGPLYVVAVQNRQVVGVYDKMPDKIPDNGYLIVSRVKFTLTDINVGDSVDYIYKSFNSDNWDEMISFYNVRTALGAGPTLVKDGQIVIDLEKEGFKGWSKYNDRQRSMIGMTKDKRLAFVVTDSMSLSALSKLAVQMGLETAMNLDGGGSTGMVVNGKYVMEPQRRVSNALVIKQRKKAPIRIVINQIEHFFDTNPYIYNDRTMVPLRGILENLDCQLSWDSETEEITVTRYGKKLIFKKDSNIVKGENREYKMDVPLIIKDSRSAISVRFLTEFMGGKVKWDKDEQIVDITIDTTKDLYEVAKSLFDDKQNEISLQFFDKVLKLNPNHIAALKYTGMIYEEGIKDYRLAAKYYERMLELYEDKDIFFRLMKCYIEAGNFDSGITLMSKLEEKIQEDKKYDTIEYYYYRGKVYENIDRKESYNSYSKLIEFKDVDNKWLDEANTFIRLYNTKYSKSKI